jgi:hypothetical protein
MMVLVLGMCWPGSMGIARTVEISAGVRTWQASVTGVAVVVVGAGVAVDSVGVEEWQPTRRRVVARRAESGGVDISLSFRAVCAGVRGLGFRARR